MQSKGIRFLCLGVFVPFIVACASVSPTPTPLPKAPPAAITPAPATPAAKVIATPPAAAPTAAPKAAAPPTATAASKAPTKLKVVYTGLSSAYTPLWIAKDEKLFEKYGLDVELEYIATATVVVPGMLAGQIPLTHGITGVPLISASLGGGDIVAIAGIINTVVQYVMVAPSIQGPADLKGKPLGVSRFGSVTDVALRFALRKLGLDPEKDVTILQMGDVPQILAGMQAGAIVGGPLSSPTDLKARELGFKEMLDIGAAGFPYPAGTVASTRSFIRSNGPTVLSYVRAMVEGTYLFKTNKALSIAVAGKYTKTDDKQMLETSWATYADKVEKIPYVSKEALLAGIEEVARDNPKAVGANPDSFVDWQFVKQLEDSGFIKQIYKE